MKNNIKILLFSLFFTGTVFAQNGQALIKKSINEQQSNLVEEFRSFLSIPNVAINPKGLQDNANWIKNYMQSKGKVGGQNKFPRVLKSAQYEDWKSFIAR